MNMMENMRSGPAATFYSVDHKLFMSRIEKFRKCYLCGKGEAPMHEICISGCEAYYYMTYGMQCRGCLVKQEKKFIKGLDQVKLPFYVNHVWVTLEGELFYKERLSYGF